MGFSPIAGLSHPDGLVPVAEPKALYLSQSIFDEESTEPTPKETPVKNPKTEGEEEPLEKPAKARKKKKAKKKKKSAKTAEASTPSRVEYTPEELAKSSYAWAPDAEVPALSSTTPGMKAVQANPGIKPAAVAASAEAIESQPAPQQKFRLPQIPLTQVLIVAGFVILFLIYRFRVGKQIKRKKY